jgi:hypothetical protein
MFVLRASDLARLETRGRLMHRKLHPFTPASLWDVGVVMAVLIAAVACCGLFFFSLGQVISAANNPNFTFGESENPWAHIATTGEGGHKTSPAVRSASLRQPPRPAKTPAF